MQSIMWAIDTAGTLCEHREEQGRHPMAEMKPYHNRHGGSGVAAYEYDDTSIRIQFVDGFVYEYATENIGSEHLDAMKALADAGMGLATYVNTHPEVRDGYSEKFEG